MGVKVIFHGATYTAPSQGGGSSSGGSSQGLGVINFALETDNDGYNLLSGSTKQPASNFSNKCFRCSTPVTIPAAATRVTGKGAVYNYNNTSRMIVFYDSNGDPIGDGINTISSQVGSQAQFTWGDVNVNIPSNAKTMRLSLLIYGSNGVPVPEEYCSYEGWRFA